VFSVGGMVVAVAVRTVYWLVEWEFSVPAALVYSSVESGVAEGGTGVLLAGMGSFPSGGIPRRGWHWVAVGGTGVSVALAVSGIALASG